MTILRIKNGMEIEPENWIDKFVFVSQPDVLTLYSSANRVLGYDNRKNKINIEFISWHKNEHGIFENIRQKNIETLDIKVSSVKIVADTENEAIRVMTFMEDHEKEYYKELHRINQSIADIDNILNNSNDMIYK